MKKTLSIILLLPVILSIVALDIIKLPFILVFVMPLSFLFGISDMLRGDSEWLKKWVGFNLEFGCFIYWLKDDLFGI